MGLLLLSTHSFKEIYCQIKQAQYTPVLAQNKLLAISVLNLLSKDDIPVYRDMLSVDTAKLNLCTLHQPIQYNLGCSLIIGDLR